MENNLKIEYIKIKDLKPYEKNARKHGDIDVEQIAKSIEKYGFNDPVGIWGDNLIVEGHGRVLACKKLGITEVPCIRLDHLTDEERREYALLHNKTAELSEWDFDILAEEIGELDFDGIDVDWGLPEKSEEIIEDDVPEIDEEAEPITQVGDIWQLGEHRLMCGDSTDALNVNILMQGEKADLVFTDPPYGVGFESKGILNDNQNEDQLIGFNKKWIPLSFEALKENGSWYCWGVDTSLMDIYGFILRPMIKENKISFRNLLTWDKGLGQNQNDANMRSYAAADEKCLFVMCGVQGFDNNTDNYFDGWEPIRKYLEDEANKVGLTAKKLQEICGVGMYSHWFTKSQWGMITEEHYKELQNYYQEAFRKEYEELKKEYYSTRAYFDNTHDNMNNVWHFPRTSGVERELTGGHATPKPIALCSRAIKSSSREKEIVLDVFGGSGSTLIACEQLNRNCYMMELEPKYCDVIIKRWETLTGKKAVRV